MKKSFSKVVSILLAIVMLASVFSCLGLTVGAAGYDVACFAGDDYYYYYSEEYAIGEIVDIKLTLNTAGNANQTYSVIVQDQQGKVVATFADSFPSTVGVSTRTFKWNTAGLKVGYYYMYVQNMFNQQEIIDRAYNTSKSVRLVDTSKPDVSSEGTSIRPAEKGTLYTPFSINDAAEINLGSEEDSFYVSIESLTTGEDAKTRIHNMSDYTWSELATAPGQTWMLLELYAHNWSNIDNVELKYYIDQNSFCNFEGMPYNILKVAKLDEDCDYSECVLDSYESDWFAIAVLTDTPVVNPYFAVKYDEYNYCYFNLDRNYADGSNKTYALGTDGEKWYAVDETGKLAEDFNGFIEYNGETYFVNPYVNFNRYGIYNGALLNAGRVDKAYNGFYTSGWSVYYITNGYVDEAFNGFQEYNGTLYYFSNGYSYPDKWINDGFQYYNGYWYYVEDGEIAWDYNGLYNGYVIANGMVDFNYNGLYKDYYYIKNGRIDYDFEALVEVNNEFRAFKNGQLNYDTTICPSFNGNWFYVRDSRIDYEYTGTARYSYYDENLEKDVVNYYIVENGVVNFGANGLYYLDKDLFDDVDGTWYLTNNGVVNRDYRGLYNHYGNWYFVEDGVWRDTSDTVTKYNGTLYKIRNGKIDWEYTGVDGYNEGWEQDFAYETEYKSYIFVNGAVTTNINGLVYVDQNPYDSSEGSWVYSQNGVLDYDFTGLVPYNGTYYYVNGGSVDWSPSLVNFNGVWYYTTGAIDYSSTLVYYNDNWYYVSGGTVQWNANTLVNYAGNWYVVTNGAVNWGYNDVYYYNGTYYAVNSGAVQWNNTLACLAGTWYHVNNGTIQWNSTTLVNYAGDWFYVENGAVNWGYTSLVNYNGTWYYAECGKINFNFNGLVNYNGTYYYVQNGVVDFGYSGLVYNTDGNWYYVQYGAIDFSYIGLVQHTDGNWYFVYGGAINWGYTGPFLHIDNNYYSIVGGTVVF